VWLVKTNKLCCFPHMFRLLTSVYHNTMLLIQNRDVRVFACFWDHVSQHHCTGLFRISWMKCHLTQARQADKLGHFSVVQNWFSRLICDLQWELMNLLNFWQRKNTAHKLLSNLRLNDVWIHCAWWNQGRRLRGGQGGIVPLKKLGGGDGYAFTPPPNI